MKLESEKKADSQKRGKKGGSQKILFFSPFSPNDNMTFCVTYFIHTLLSYYNNQKKKKMTINDHDQFTGLNAVHVAASPFSATLAQVPSSLRHLNSSGLPENSIITSKVPAVEPV